MPTETLVILYMTSSFTIIFIISNIGLVFTNCTIW